MSFIYIIKYNNNIIGTYDCYDKANNYILSLLQNNFINNISNIIIYKYILNSGHYIETIQIKSELLNQKTKFFDETIKFQKNLIIESHGCNPSDETIHIKSELLNQKTENFDKTIKSNPCDETIQIESELSNKKSFENSSKFSYLEIEQLNPEGLVLDLKASLSNEQQGMKSPVLELETLSRVEQENINLEKIDKINKDKIDLQHNINMLNIKKQKILESKQIYDNDIKLYNLFNEKIINEPGFKIPELFENKYNIFKKLDLENKLSWDTFILEYDNNINDYDDYFISNNYEKNISEDIIIDSE